MFASRTFTGALFALAVAIGPVGGALAETAHDPGASAASLELRLDNGSRWRTDDPLRTGMSAIRSALEGSLPAIRDGGFAPQDYANLARSLATEAGEIVTNCRLPEAADMQLHIILAQLLDGAAMMETASGREDGVVKAVGAVNAYGAYFDHPDWRKLSL